MQNTGTLTIVLLVVSAMVLTAMLVGGFCQTSTSAQATGASARLGNYILASGQWTADVDLLYVINITARRLNVYYANTDTNAVELIDSVDLERAFTQE